MSYIHHLTSDYFRSIHNDVSYTAVIEKADQTVQDACISLDSLSNEYEMSLQHDCNRAIANYMNTLAPVNDKRLGVSQNKKSPSVKSASSQLNPSWENVVNYARAHLPLEGKLSMKPDGFVYVKVNDEYIHTLFPMLQLEEKEFKEPPYFRSSNSPGAHISVFYEDEHIVPKEIGETFHFKLKQIVLVRTSRKASYVVLQVESLELEELRKKYGLSPKLHGHEYHISLAKS
jgi:hypothetical protein